MPAGDPEDVEEIRPYRRPAGPDAVREACVPSMAGIRRACLGATLATANLGLIALLIGSEVPTPRRMERWSRRLAAGLIDTLPPPGFLD